MGEPALKLLLVVFVSLTAVFAVAYYRLRLRLGDAVLEALGSWKERELGELRAQLWQAAQSQADARLERWRVEAEAEIREDAVRRSSAVVSGKVSEHLAPYMAAFPYNPKDARFLGTPIDLLVFDGLSEDDLREIVFLEIKSGGARHSRRASAASGMRSWRGAWPGGSSASASSPYQTQTRTWSLPSLTSTRSVKRTELSAPARAAVRMRPSGPGRASSAR